MADPVGSPSPNWHGVGGFSIAGGPSGPYANAAPAPPPEPSDVVASPAIGAPAAAATAPAPQGAGSNGVWHGPGGFSIASGGG